MSSQDIDFQTIAASLAQPDWYKDPFYATDHDSRAIGIMLAALSQVMLPFWEARYRRDEQIERLVRLLEAWAVAPSPQTQLVLANCFQSMSVEKYAHGHLFLSMPSDMMPLKPPEYRYPGDLAGDSIYYAARHISLLQTIDYDAMSPAAPIGYSAENWHDQTEYCCMSCSVSIEAALHTVSQTMGHRHPEDETTNFWTIAHEQIRAALLEKLQSWYPDVPWRPSDEV